MRVKRSDRAWRWLLEPVLRWARIETIDSAELTGRERLQVALAIVGPALRRDFIVPVRDWVFRHAPTRALTLRLKPRGRGWYEVPTRKAALHASIRFKLPVHSGEFLRVLDGKLVAIGLLDEVNQRSEFWFIDEIDKPDPPLAVKLARHP